MESLSAWLRNDFLPGVLIVLGGLLLLRVVRWIEERYRQDIDAKIRAAVDRDDVASERLKRSRAILRAISWTASVVITIAAVTFGLHVMGVPLSTLIAPATVAGVALGFGAQQVVGDLLAGFFLLAEHQFGYGDVIRFAPPGDAGGVTGTVEEVTLRVTKLRTTQGELVIVPNGSLRQVTNLSKDWSRAVVDLPIAIDEDLERATSVLRAAAHAMVAEEDWSHLVLGEPVVTGVESFEIGWVRVRVLVRTLPGRQFEVARELRLRLATALTEADIATVAVELTGP